MTNKLVIGLCILSLCGVGCSSQLAAGGGGDGSGDPAQDGSGAGSDGNGGGAGSSAVGNGGGAGAGSSGGSSVPGGFIPMFPGAGESGVGEPLENGMLCDAAGKASDMPTAGDVTRCFFGPDDKMNPAATVEQVLECVEGVDVLHLRLTFDPTFVDNTYGDGAVGWPEKRGHTMKDLKGSDHAEIKVVDGNGDVALQFKVDYISEDADAASGFASAGVDGGDGEIISGDRDMIVDVSTSLHENLNVRGYSDYTEHSPETDDSFSSNPDAPDWDFRMVYEVWIDLDAFGDGGFAGAFIDFVHASPSKTDSNTIEVTPGDCPPDWDPDCDDPNGCQECVPQGPDDNSCGDSGNPPDITDPCNDGDPDTDCGDGQVPPKSPPAFCDLYPTDPACYVD